MPTGQHHRRKTHCPHGHPYAGENLYVSPSGHRYCRECRKRYHRNGTGEPWADYIDVAPLRAAFLESGLSRGELARLIGWTRRKRGRDGFGDDRRLANTLGLRPYNPGHGYPPKVRERIGRGLAARIADVLGLDPVDVGL